MDTDAVIAEATKVAPEAKASLEAEAVETNKAEDAAPEEGVDKAVKPDDALTPEQLKKREANRQSHLNSKLAKMKRENRELRELVERSTQQKAQPQAKEAPVPPKEEDYQTWDELQAATRKYYEEMAEWKIEQKFSERDKKSTEQAETSKVDGYKVERINHHATKEVEFAKQVPDYEQTVYGEYGEFMANIPRQVAEALIEADRPELALYALAKEGSLESLEDMSPYKISMEIGKAELRGESLLQGKATNAPPPVEAARGTGKVGKPINNMSYGQLRDEFKLY